MNYPQWVFGWFLDLLFPAKCIFCGLISNDRSYVCRKCFKLLPLSKKFECLGCRRYSKFGQTCFVCKRNYFVDHVFVASNYNDDGIKKLIKYYKYRFIADLAKPLSDLVSKYLFWLSNKKSFNIFQNSPLLIPIPLNSRRLNWRGFNQSELLASELSKITNLDLVADLLFKHKSLPQADIKKRQERLANVIGKFKYIGEDLKGKDIVLIDDVCTTGATLSECAKVLKANGAGKVYALVIARG